MIKTVQNAVRRGALALTVSAISMGAAHAQTLSDALATAYEHSGLLEQNRALLRAADEDVAIAVSALRPIIGWSGSVNADYLRNGTSALSTTGWDTYANIGISADLLLFDNGQSKLAIESAKETVLATRQALVSVEQRVLFSAVQAFMNVVADDEIVKLRQNNLRLLQRELQAAQDRFEVGEVTRTDVALAEARLAGARAQLAAAQGDLEASKEEYAAAVGERPGNLVTPRSLPKAANSIEEAKGVAVKSHPDMLQAQYQISASELNVERARAAMGPQIKLRTRVGARREFDSSAFSDSASVGLELGGPIYYGGQLSAALRKTMAARDGQRANLHVVRHGIRQQAGTAWARLLAAGAQIQASVRQVEAARIAFEGVREEAKLGARTTLDVLTAEQDLLDAEADRIDAQAVQIVAAYAVLSSMGLLTVDHLNLRVERYDPEAYFNLVKSAPTISSEQGKKLDRVLKAIGKQ